MRFLEYTIYLNFYFFWQLLMNVDTSMAIVHKYVMISPLDTTAVVDQDSCLVAMGSGVKVN